jgi:Ca2+-binding RTX toxin-like protein
MATLTVTTAADVVDAGDGVLSLREAVQQANATAAADTIQFTDVLKGQTLTLTQGQLMLTADVTIDGDRNGDGSEVTLDAAGASRVFTVGGVGTEVRLSDLTLTGGKVVSANGGGVLVAAGNSLHLAGATITGNESLDGSGGGVFVDAGGSLSVERSAITTNTANNSAGGIFVGVGGSLRLDRSLLDGNRAVGYGFESMGGGLLLIGSTAVVSNSTISGNQSYGGGGGITGFGADVRLSTSTVAGNVGVYAGDSNFDTIGGIYLADRSCLRLASCTVTGNRTVDGPGTGGIAVSSLINYGYTPVRVANSIVLGNGGSDLALGAATPSSNGHNVFGRVVGAPIAVPGDAVNASPSEVFAAIDPLTGGGRLALNGGPTPTVALRNAATNPALAGADPLTVADVDQRGVARPAPGTSLPDVGAFELAQTAISTSPSPNNDALTGTPDADRLVGLAGNDRIRGLGGGDTLLGREGSDVLAGGDGDDRAFGGVGVDLLQGGAGADGLRGWDGDDTLRGGAGTDRLFGEGGDDGLAGGAGDDIINGGAGVDLASWLADGGPAGVGVLADLAQGRATRGAGESDALVQVERLEGTNWADTLSGDALANTLSGAAGADRLFGRGGDDLLRGGFGADLLDGGSGAKDLVSYEEGTVGVVVRLADDRAARGVEVDRIPNVEGAIGSNAADRLRGDAAANELRGLDGDDHLFGGRGGDALSGGNGVDRFDYDGTADSPFRGATDVIADFTRGVDRLDLSTIDANAATPELNEAFVFIGLAAFSASGQVRFANDRRGIPHLQANTDADLRPELDIEFTPSPVVSPLIGPGDFVL